jgi:hypothetical protein
LNINTLRKNLVQLLEGGAAHTDVEAALRGVEPEARGRRPAPGIHSVWEELEHMRIAQEDILRYTLDASWRSPEWPSGYWPADDTEVSDHAWNASVRRFFDELREVIALVEREDIDLTAEIPHGEGRTYLRQVLLVADHNAYHLGQIVQTRKLLGDWKA